MALYEEMHAAGLAQKPYGTASYLEQFSKKLQRTIVSLTVETHLYLFACMDRQTDQINQQDGTRSLLSAL